MLNLNVGDMIKTSLSENTVVLDLDPKQQEAILMADSTFVLAHNLTKEKDGTYSWQAGQYEKSMEEILSVKNPKLSSSPKQTLEENELDFSDMRENILNLMNNNYKTFITALISIENQLLDPKILENAYEVYMNKDFLGLINPQIFELKEENMERDKIIITSVEQKNGYKHPFINFSFKDIEGVFDDQSCEDGYKAAVTWNNLTYLYDSIEDEYEESNFDMNNKDHREFAETFNEEIRDIIRYKQDIEREKGVVEEIKTKTEEKKEKTKREWMER